MQAKRFRFGSISWTYADWKGVFYPPKATAEELLERYASVFDLVEVDNTFYRMPKTEVVEAWAASTPPGFEFAPKMRSSVLKTTALEEAGPGIDAFLTRMEPLRKAGKLGPVLLQFPPFFKRGKRGDAFDAFVRALPAGVKWAVELRDDSWWDPATYDALRSVNAALVWSFNEYAQYPSETTADWLYTRFLGDRELEKFDRIQRDKRAELEAWKEALDKVDVRDVYVLVSSRFMGYSPETIQLVQEVLGLPKADLSPAARATGQAGLDV